MNSTNKACGGCCGGEVWNICRSLADDCMTHSSAAPTWHQWSDPTPVTLVHLQSVVRHQTLSVRKYSTTSLRWWDQWREEELSVEWWWSNIYATAPCNHQSGARAVHRVSQTIIEFYSDFLWKCDWSRHEIRNLWIGCCLQNYTEEVFPYIGTYKLFILTIKKWLYF